MSTHHTKTTLYQRSLIGLAGVIAALIGIAITVFPVAFYASYDVLLPTDPNLLSELRAPGANLAVLGLIMLAGAFKSHWFATARLIGIAVFFAFATGRLISWGIDGTPNASILSALAIEVVMGVLLVLAKGRTNTIEARFAH